MNDYLEKLGNNIKFIDVKDLKKGDVILFSRVANEIICAKVLAPPNKSKMKCWHVPTRQLYTAVKCSTTIIESTRSYTGWKGNIINRTYKEYRLCPPSEHNSTKRFDFNYKQLILINNEE